MLILFCTYFFFIRTAEGRSRIWTSRTFDASGSSSRDSKYALPFVLFYEATAVYNCLFSYVATINGRATGETPHWSSPSDVTFICVWSIIIVFVFIFYRFLPNPSPMQCDWCLFGRKFLEVSIYWPTTGNCMH